MVLGRACVALVLVAALAQWVGAAEAEKAEAVDFRELKKLFPEKLGELKRNEATGEKMKMGEYAMSIARANYGKENDESENPATIEIEVMDYGGTKGMAEGFALWGTIEIDRDSDGGYEKTVKVGGHAGLESYQTEEKRGNLQLFVAGRFLVHVRIENLPADRMKKTAETYPLDKLAALKAGK